MKILQVHNRYKSTFGGEDSVVSAERDLLIENGQQVQQYIVSNAEIETAAPWQFLRSSFEAVWSVPQYRALIRAIEACRPDIVHVHNTFARLSPSIFWAIRQTGVPCVFTLHNYRLVCPSSALFRDGQYCDRCVGRYPLPAVQYGCSYNGSRSKALAIAATQAIHRGLGTFARQVDAFIVLNPTFAALMKHAGIPEEKIHVKYNFVFDAWKDARVESARKPQIVYAGHVAEPKGIAVLLQAWARREEKHTRLLIIGDGPDRARLQDEYRSRTDIEWLGSRGRSEVLQIMRTSRFLVMPSLLPEPFGLVAVEALMMATPVIFPDHIALRDILSGRAVGFTYDARQVDSLRNALHEACRTPPQTWERLSGSARETYRSFFTPEKNYLDLSSIYHSLTA